MGDLKKSIIKKEKDLEGKGNEDLRNIDSERDEKMEKNKKNNKDKETQPHERGSSRRLKRTNTGSLVEEAQQKDDNGEEEEEEVGEHSKITEDINPMEANKRQA